MNDSLFRSVSVVLALCAMSAMAGLHYTRMVESKPVVANGLELIAAAEAEWFCFNPPVGQDPVQVQLFLRNTTPEPLLFSVFDSFGITIKDAHGNPVVQTGGRDGTLRTKPVLIDAGARYCLSREASLRWNPDGKSLTFSYYDGTGSVANYGPLVAGDYTLSFWCEQAEKNSGNDEGPRIRTWIGKAVTKEVAFKIMDR
jgi:hypothetical protein